MKRLLYIFLSLISISQIAFSQCDPSTAVAPFSNGDFNIYTPPAAISLLPNAAGWLNPTTTSPDLFDSSFLGDPTGIASGGTVSPNGGAWAGVITLGDSGGDFVEYIARELDTPLSAGTYQLVAEFGAGIADSDGIGGHQTLDAVVYGIPNASSLPVSISGVITTAGIGAVELGRTTITLTPNSWIADVVIPLTVAGAFESIVVGFDPASLDPADPATGTFRADGVYEYTLIDNIRLTANLTTDPACVACSIDDLGSVVGTCTGSNDLEFVTTITGSNTGATYTVSGATPTTGTYGTPTMFTIASGADRADKIITITDDTDTACTLDITITGAAACFSCPSGADAPRFLGLTRSTWITMGIVSVVAVSGGVLLKKIVF